MIKTVHPNQLLNFMYDYGDIRSVAIRERMNRLLKPMYKESQIEINCWVEEHNPYVLFVEVVETVGEHVYRFRMTINESEIL